MKKILAIDAVGCLVNLKGEINLDILNLINHYNNKKIILTNADSNERKIFLKKVNYEVFSLNHKPEKKETEYFKKFLNKYKFNAKDIIYFEHNIDAVKSARSNDIITHHYDGNLKKLKKFLDKNLT